MNEVGNKPSELQLTQSSIIKVLIIIVSEKLRLIFVFSTRTGWQPGKMLLYRDVCIFLHIVFLCQLWYLGGATSSSGYLSTALGNQGSQKKMLKIKQKGEFLNFSETCSGISEVTTNPVTYLRDAFFISATNKDNDLYGKFWTKFWKYVIAFWIKAEVKKDCFKAMQETEINHSKAGKVHINVITYII